MERMNDTVLLVGRLLMASLFLSAGIPKVLDFGVGFAGYLAKLGVPYPEYVGILAIAVEVLVPVALILGLWPRLSALLLIAFVIVATGLAHRFWEFPAGQPQQLQMAMFFKNVALIGGLLLYYAAGPGRFAVSGRSASVGTAQPARA